MKVNVQIEVTDEQRGRLCKLIRPKGKVAPLFSRKEVRELVTGFVDALLNESPDDSEQEIQTPTPTPKTYLTEPNGDPALKGKSPSYCRGWNQVKFRKGYKL